MSTTLIVAITFIFSALGLYTVGVWSEKLGGRLKWWHAIVFYFGVTADTIGTGAMGVLAGNIIQFNLHGITGGLAILLMLFHAVWATIVLVRKDEAMIKSFHKLSLVVWIIWLIPMIGGIILGSSV
jgi:uncharacterized repeat protein (TIGR03987 family)